MDSKPSSCFRTRSSSHYSVFGIPDQTPILVFGSNPFLVSRFRNKPISRIPDPIPVPGFRIRHNLNPAFRITLLRFGILNKALIGSQIPDSGLRITSHSRIPGLYLNPFSDSEFDSTRDSGLRFIPHSWVPYYYPNMCCPKA